jgi:lipoate-protein ligase A
MHVVRGRATPIERDRAVVTRLLSWAGEGNPAVRAWSPARQVAFGRRDARAEGYDRARRAARDRGFAPYERSVGGRAVAYTGRTVAFAFAQPTDGRGSIDDRYDRITNAVRRALTGVGAEVVSGEPPDAFCAGDHSLRGAGPTGTPAGGKVVGVAQRVRAGAALTSGIVLVDGPGASELIEVLRAVYDALSVPFDPESVGGVASAGGPDDPLQVARAVERALIALVDDGQAETVDAEVVSTPDTD